MMALLVQVLILTIILVFVATTDKQQAGEAHCKKDISAADDDCGLAGVWRNQLGSYLNLTCSDGQIFGWYQTAVGQAPGKYVMSGRYLQGPQGTTLLGWVVAWQNDYGNSRSSTSWSGIHYREDDVIRTQWILTAYQPMKDYWSSSLINHDEFKRQNVCSEELLNAEEPITP